MTAALMMKGPTGKQQIFGSVVPNRVRESVQERKVSICNQSKLSLCVCVCVCVCACVSICWEREVLAFQGVVSQAYKHTSSVHMDLRESKHVERASVTVCVCFIFSLRVCGRY